MLSRNIKPPFCDEFEFGLIKFVYFLARCMTAAVKYKMVSVDVDGGNWADC